MPRKTLRITGAPPTKFSKLYKLPEIPWGTKADADFVSTEPAVMPDGKRPDLSKETHFNDGGMGFLRQMGFVGTDEQVIARAGLPRTPRTLA